MPFKLRGARGTLQAVMNHMFFWLIGRGVIAYLDGLLVHSPDVESHAKLLDRVLKTPRENKMCPKFSRATFGSNTIEYLGYRVSNEGIAPGRGTVKAIEVLPEELQNDT